MTMLGHNQPKDATGEIIDRLAADYDQLARNAGLLVASGQQLDVEIANERELEGVSNVVVAMRDAINRADAARKAEKEPYLRGGQAVDGFFAGIAEKLDRARRTLQRRVDDYQNAKLRREREQRRLAAEQAAREEQARRDEAARLAREAEERRLAAERARKPETIEEKSAIATAAEQEAATAAVAASTAADAAETARIETLRKSSEVARSRFDEGRLVTMRQVGYAELVDRDKVDMVALRPYFTDAEIAKALRGWAKATGHAKQMPGASIGMRDEAVVR